MPQCGNWNERAACMRQNAVCVCVCVVCGILCLKWNQSTSPPSSLFWLWSFREPLFSISLRKVRWQTVCKVLDALVFFVLNSQRPEAWGGTCIALLRVAQRCMEAKMINFLGVKWWWTRGSFISNSFKPFEQGAFFVAPTWTHVTHHNHFWNF